MHPFNVVIIFMVFCSSGAFSRMSEPERLLNGPLVCSTNGQPLVYNIPANDPCAIGDLTSAYISITYDRPLHTLIRGWRIRVMNVVCTTHYFFWGSYTHDFSMTRSRDINFPDMSQGAACPEGTWKYTNDKDMEKMVCIYSWPGSSSSSSEVCFVEKATLMSFEGVTTVDGHPIKGCEGNVCPLTASEVFYHSSPQPVSDTESVVHYSGEALCNDAVCMVPSLQEAYPIIEVTAIDDSTWIQYKSVANTLIHRVASSSPTPAPSGSLPIADSGVIAKIISLNVDIRALKGEVDNLCLGLKNLYSFIQGISVMSPTAAARLYLNRTDLYAMYSNGYLMVWPCITVTSWSISNSTGCTRYVPIMYSTHDGNKTGFLNQMDNIVYDESPISKCQVHHIMLLNQLAVVHQYPTEPSQVKIINTTVLTSNSFFPKITYNTSEWASSCTSIDEMHPREFSYEDLTEPRPGTSKPWIEEEIETRYPIIPYLIHVKMAALLTVLIIIIVCCIIIRFVMKLQMRLLLLEGAYRDYAILRRL